MTDKARLYLVVGAAAPLAGITDDLADALDRVDVACVELDLPDLLDSAWLPTIDALRPVAQDRDVAFLIRDRAGLAASSGCDGVRLASFADFARARRAVGEAIVGVDAGRSRHAAMLAGEAEADFVGLGPDPEGGPSADMVAWWADLMEVPGVAFGARGPVEAAAIAAAGADFVAVDPRLWQGAESLVEALLQADRSLDAAG